MQKILNRKRDAQAFLRSKMYADWHAQYSAWYWNHPLVQQRMPNRPPPNSNSIPPPPHGGGDYGQRSFPSSATYSYTHQQPQQPKGLSPADSAQYTNVNQYLLDSDPSGWQAQATNAGVPQAASSRSNSASEAFDEVDEEEEEARDLFNSIERPSGLRYEHLDPNQKKTVKRIVKWVRWKQKMRSRLDAAIDYIPLLVVLFFVVPDGMDRGLSEEAYTAIQLSARETRIKMGLEKPSPPTSFGS